MANSLLAVLGITEQLAPVYGFRPITPDILPKLRTMHAQKIIKTLGVKSWMVPLLMMAVRRRLCRQIPDMTLQPGLYSLLEKLSKQTTSLGILSSNSKKNIYQFLSKHQLEMIDYVHVEKYKLSKHRALGCLLKKNKLQLPNTYYIVDEVRDIEAARA